MMKNLTKQTSKLNHFWIFLPLISLLFFQSQRSKASSGETEFIINENGQIIVHRSLYNNQYGSDNDLEQGAFLSYSQATEKTSTMLNGFPVSHTTLNNAKQPGVRGIIHHERQWEQHENINTSNFFSDYYIENVDYKNNTITVKEYTNLPGNVVNYKMTTINYNEETLMKHEGIPGDEKSVFVPKRYLRVYEPRPMVVYSFDPEVVTWKNSNPAWMRMGFFRGEKGDTYFAEYKNGEWVNTFATGRAKDIDGYRRIPEGGNSVARPGDRILTAPRMVGHTTAAQTSYGNYIPHDEGSVIGTIIKRESSKVTVEVKKCPTGLAEDGYIDTVEVTINNDAKFHHNGQKGSSKSQALKEGNYVRILPDISNGMYLSRETDVAGAKYQKLNNKPIINTIFPSNNPEEFSWNVSFQQKEQVTITENQKANIELLVYGKNKTKIKWHKNGNYISGTESTITIDGDLEPFKKISLSKRFTMNDNNSLITATATTANGTVRSEPVELIVKPDNTQPSVSDGIIQNKNSIKITFSEKVDKESAENKSNYSINNKISINNISLTGDKKTVVINTSDMKMNNTYDITMNNIKDIASSPNMIASNSSISLSYSNDNSNKETQTINFPSISNKDIKDTVKLNATASSGLPVSYQVTEGYAEIKSENQLILKDTGKVTVKAMQKGNGNYYSAYPAMQSFQVSVNNKISQTISFDPIKDTISAEALPYTFQINASSSSGLMLDFEITEGSGAISAPKTASINNRGKITIKAMQKGNHIYKAASPVTQTFYLDSVKGDPSIRIRNFEQKLYLDKKEEHLYKAIVKSKFGREAPIQPEISWKVEGAGSIDSEGNYTAPSETGGPHFVIATATKNSTELSDTAVVYVRKSQSISCPNAPDSVYYKEKPFVINCTSTSGLPVEYDYQLGPMNLHGDIVEPIGVLGTATIFVQQEGNDFYKPSNKIDLKITFTKDKSDTVEGDTVIASTISKNNAISKKINIYPNPTKGKIYVDMKNISAKEARLYSSKGQLLVNKKIGKSKSNTPLLIDLSKMDKGIYFLRAGNKIKKIIKK